MERERKRFKNSNFTEKPSNFRKERTIESVREQKPAIKVDRENACPSLMRVFVRVNSDIKEEDFPQQTARIVAPANSEEYAVHVWMDSTLRELSDQLKEVCAKAREWGTKMYFGFMYPDKMGKFVIRDVGSVHANHTGIDDAKVLDNLRFQPGDFLVVGLYEKGVIRPEKIPPSHGNQPSNQSFRPYHRERDYNNDNNQHK